MSKSFNKNYCLRDGPYVYNYEKANKFILWLVRDLVLNQEDPTIVDLSTLAECDWIKVMYPEIYFDNNKEKLTLVDYRTVEFYEGINTWLELCGFHWAWCNKMDIPKSEYIASNPYNEDVAAYLRFRPGQSFTNLPYVPSITDNLPSVTLTRENLLILDNLLCKARIRAEHHDELYADPREEEDEDSIRPYTLQQMGLDFNNEYQIRQNFPGLMELLSVINRTNPSSMLYGNIIDELEKLIPST